MLSAADDLCPISLQIWDQKYRLKDQSGEPIDQTIEDTWRRVALALADVDREQGAGYNARFSEFYQALEGFKFLPAGRILAGAGTGRRVTLFNCFVMGTIEDDLSRIFDHLKEAALTMQQGGGIGYDFSTLRPQGAPVLSVGADASGPLTFMDTWDAMCKTIMSAGARRGAMMATMRCDHPDIQRFIVAKQDPARLRNFNLSVLVTDDFMNAIARDGAWELKFGGRVYARVSARELWDQIMRSTYDAAEPGVIFIDRINNLNNLKAFETIAATNPCGEQPLPPYGACLLGSINVTRFVLDPFRAHARIDEPNLIATVRTAVRMLDNVVDASGYPLPAQKDEAYAKRRIGLGMTGLANVLMMCNLPYASRGGLEMASYLARTIFDAAYAASAQLAREKGFYPLWSLSEFKETAAWASLSESTRDLIKRHGLRNSHLTSIAPTGTISLFADNVSSGIEPVFSHSYVRKVLNRDGTKREERVVDHAARLWERERSTTDDPNPPYPDHFDTAQTLAPGDHVAMQAVVQSYIDSAISKTVNLPADISFDDFKQVYRDAYDLGCKGCTTYRPNAITGSILSVDAPVEAVKEKIKEVIADLDKLIDDASEASQPPWTSLAPRPNRLVGSTYKLKWPPSPHAFYVTINHAVIDDRLAPFEIFINSKNLEHQAWVVALTRMISAVFRKGGDVSFIAEELKQVFDPMGGSWHEGAYVPSLVAALGNLIQSHLEEHTEAPHGGHEALNPVQDPKPIPEGQSLPTSASVCRSCGYPSLVREGGCDVCKQCGWSRCG